MRICSINIVKNHQISEPEFQEVLTSGVLKDWRLPLLRVLITCCPRNWASRLRRRILKLPVVFRNGNGEN